MRAQAIVPINHLSRAKSRLGVSLPERQRLVLDMLDGVLTALLESRRLARVLVVSPDPRVGERARARGAEFLEQVGRGLNPALEQARTRLFTARAGTEGEALLVALGDLPRLQAAQVSAMLDLIGPGSALALAPDRARRGTNLLAVTPPAAIRFAFGPDSLERHRSQALACGLKVRLYCSQGTELDLDTPADLVVLQRV